MSVVSVSLSAAHEFTKKTADAITLIEDVGVEGDCHNGPTVQHRSRLQIQPPPRNLRQVHLMPLEILSERQLNPGEIGENITTTGLDLLHMGTGTKLRFLKEMGDGEDDAAVVVVMGLRNPCHQIEKFRKGLQETFVVRDETRKIVERKAGVMGTVERSGTVEKGMRIVIEEPETFTPLAPV